MGQYWDFYNLDKREKLNYGGKLGEDLFGSYSDLFPLLFNCLGNPAANPTWSWAGDRIIYIGDYAEEYPEGLLTEDEEKELGEDGLFAFGQEHYTAASHFDTRKIPGPPWVLRNMSTHEYVHSDAVEFVNTGPDLEHYIRLPGIMEALVTRLCWSSDSSVSMCYEARWTGIRPLHRGLWAGNRFDIVADSNFDVRVGWKDVSAALRREMFRIWTTEWGGDVVGSWETKGVKPQRSTDIPFSKFNHDILRYILEAAAKEDIMDATTFSCVSKLINTWMKPVMYRSVIVEHDSRLESFCDALESNPKLGLEIHRLFIRTGDDIGPITPSKVISATLRRCANIKILVTDINMESLDFEDDETSGSSWSALQQIMAIPETSILPPKDHPLLRNVTHLCVDFQEWKALMSLPETLSRLTHLAVFSAFPYRERIEDFLKTNTSLRVMLLIAKGRCQLPKAPLVGNQWAEIAEIKDERLFARRGLDIEGYEDIMNHGATVFDNVEKKYADWRNTIPRKSTTNTVQEEDEEEKSPTPEPE